MKLVVCLGNPGSQYSKTRHNVGFMFADKLVQNLSGSFTNEGKFRCELAKTSYKNEAIWIVKPQTYMNLSGESLSLLSGYYKINFKDLFIVYDDISLELGKIRFRTKGSDGGHNGVKSIIKHSGTQTFDRMKIGIGPQPSFMKSESFVLQNFNNDEFIQVEQILNTAVESFLYYCENDINKVQNKYN